MNGSHDTIRVAFDIHTIGARATGNETYAECLLDAFEAEPAPDIELHYYHSKTIERANGNPRYRRLRPHWPYVRIPFTTPWRLLRDRIDVAHFQYMGPPLSPCATVLTVHDLSFERHPEFFSRAMSVRMRLLMRHLALRASRIIAVSEATRRDLLDLYVKLRPENVVVVYNGAPSYCAPLANPDGMRRVIGRLRLPSRYIVCVGNLGPRKNQRGLVRAYARLVRDRHIAEDLVLVGKPVLGAHAIFEEIAAHGLEQRVHVTGFVSPQELVALYNLATFSVYPSLYEGFGLPIVESMACGTPVITSNVSCMPEIAGDAALLVAPEDPTALGTAMLTMLEDASLRARLRKAGIERAARFSWMDAARGTRDVYRAAAGS